MYNPDYTCQICESGTCQIHKGHNHRGLFAVFQQTSKVKPENLKSDNYKLLSKSSEYFSGCPFLKQCLVKHCHPVVK